MVICWIGEEFMSTPEKPLRRSDLIRQRRVSSPRRRTTLQPLKRGSRPQSPSVPPILVREGRVLLPSNAPQERVFKRPKRRYDVALSVPGAEVRLPSLPRVRMGWRLLSGALTLLLSAALYIVWNSPMYRVSQVEVKGLQRLSVEEVSTILDLEDRSVFMIDPKRVEQELLEAFPQLLGVSVQVDIPARVMVTLRERQPVLVWKQGEEALWVDASGVAFPPYGEPPPSVVVEVEGTPFTANSAVDTSLNIEGGQGRALKNVERFLPPQLVSAILAVSHRMLNNVSLKYSETHGLGWRDSRGFDVYLGVDTTDTEMKLLVYQAIMDYLDREQIQPAMVSIEQLHAPYFRMEP